MSLIKKNEFGTPTGLTATGGAVLAAVLFVLFFFIFCFRTVAAGETGVVTRFGSVSREVQPGITIKLPWPVERLHKFNVKTAKEEVKTQAGTKDSQIINSQVAVNYHIERGKAGDVYSKLGDKYLETVLMPRVQTIFKNQTPAFAGNELLANRAKIESATLLAIQKEFDGQGIKVEQFSIIDFGFSPAISQAIENKQVAQQQAEQASYLAEKARQEALATVETAKGQAEAQRLLKETLNPEVLQSQAINRWDGHMPSAIGTGTIFNIPLGAK